KSKVCGETELGSITKLALNHLALISAEEYYIRYSLRLHPINLIANYWLAVDFNHGLWTVIS
ncbi:MAG: hypothetical protein MK317_12500, partial [Pseudomonadales bacterium]|nr:hypothetical protein [Pseudomonadales bacterium]